MLTGSLNRMRTVLRRVTGLAAELEVIEVVGHTFTVHRGSFRAVPDYDDAWILALARRSKIAFDVGTNLGQAALTMLLSPTLELVVCIEPNVDALVIAAENVIRNRQVDRVRFVAKFAGDCDAGTVKFWTVGSGAAGSAFPEHGRTAAKQAASTFVPVTSIDALCQRYEVIPDFIKVDVEGAESQVLFGSSSCARKRQTRFLVEMHSNSDVPMHQNAAKVMAWCSSADFTPYYLKNHEPLVDPVQIAKRGRCHLLLQPSEWPYPEWMQIIAQGAALS